MNLRIRPLQSTECSEIDEVVRLSLLAWAPVFDSFAQVLGAEIYTRLYPDWQTSQRAVVRAVCEERASTTVWVADVDGTTAGFIAVELNAEEGVGEVQLLAVHPAYQDRGIGTALNTFALGQMKEVGMRLAVAATGGDPGHAPARRSYEKAGYTPLPLVRYYKDL
jgi:ribosomal protein S18 acetylase RimI-like enzyme